MITLVLFMTHGSSLSGWKEAGILDRELALYNDHNNAGIDVHIITHGTRSDKEIASAFPFINVHYNKLGLHPRLYAMAIPLLHRSVLQSADLYKTNQAYGAHSVYSAARLWKKPWIMRQGYGHFENRQREHGKHSKQAARAFSYERKYMRLASANIVTSENLAKVSAERHQLDEKKLHILPNYVVTDIWEPTFRRPKQTIRKTLAYVGRLSHEKNLPSLIEACSGLNMDLKLIGSGSQQQELVILSKQLGVNCKFYGQLPQTEVRKVLQKADVFVLPSLYEGHPKALIEAMAFGILVLGSDVEGIRDIIQDGETGLLAPKNASGLRTGLIRYLNMSDKDYTQISTKARHWAYKTFSLQQVGEQERVIFSDILVKFQNSIT